MIKMEQVKKVFDSGFSLNEIDLKIEAGEKVSLFGPNGAGKTTLLRILAGLIRPTSGSLTVLEQGYHKRKEILRHLGLALQSGQFYETLTIRQNLEFYGKMYALEPKKLSERIVCLLHTFNLQEKANQKVSQLSKGMKQRLIIIKALLHDPQLLLLDEPFSGLDLESSEYLLTFLDTLSEKTILTATHDFEFGIREDRRIIIINNGDIVFDGRWQKGVAEFKDFYRKVVGQC